MKQSVVHLLFISQCLLFVYQEISRKIFGTRKAENHRKHQENQDLKYGCFHKMEICSKKKKEEDVVQSSGEDVKGREGRGGEGFGGDGEAVLEPITRPYILAHPYISFLLNPWKILLHAIFGSQQTKEKRLSMETSFYCYSVR